MEKYLFFNSTQMDRRRHQASDMADYWQSFLSNGLIHNNGKPQLELMANNTNRNITLKKGKALLQGHLYVNTDDLVLRIDNPDSLLDRIDRIVLRFDNTIENRYIKAFVKKGVEASNPIPPQLIRAGDIYEISLAQIKVVAGKSFVEQTDIVDERLNEMTCGLASSLVSVPTDIFNAEFQAYMQQITAEWQTWFNRVVNDTYITNTQFNTRNRQVDRQLANLNAIADIDNRAIGNTGKFYDLFDGSNDKSVAMLDKNIHSIDSDITSSQLTFDTSFKVNFKVGQEVSFFGLKTSAETTPTKIDRIVTNVSGTKFTINTALGVNFISGAVVVRSTVKDNQLSSVLTFKNWGEVQENTLPDFNYWTTSGNYVPYSQFSANTILSENERYLYHETYNNSDSAPVTPKWYRFDKNENKATLSNVPVGTKFKCNGKYALNGNILYKVGAITDTVELTQIATIPNATSKSPMIEIDGFIYIGTSILNSGSYYYQILSKVNLATNEVSEVARYRFYGNGTPAMIDQDLNMHILANESSSIHKVLKYNKSTNIFTEINTTQTVSTYSLQYSMNVYNKYFFYCVYSGSPSYFYSFLKSDGTVQLINLSSILPTNTTSTNDISISKDGRFLSLTQPNSIKIYAITINTDETLNFTLLLAKTYSETASYYMFYSGFIMNSEKMVRLWYSNGTTSANGFKAKLLNGVKDLNVDIVARYNFNQPLKNLAGWLVTKTAPSSVQASLSMVDNTQNESYKTLTVTKKDNEYEFLETANTVPKDKVTLKLSVNGGSLEKLLGAIE